MRTTNLGIALRENDLEFCFVESSPNSLNGSLLSNLIGGNGG